MAEIDEISAALGRLEAGDAFLRERATYHDILLREIGTKLELLSGTPSRVGALEVRVGIAEGAIEKHESWRQRAIGIAMGLGMASGVVGAFIFKQLGLS